MTTPFYRISKDNGVFLVIFNSLTNKAGGTGSHMSSIIKKKKNTVEEGNNLLVIKINSNIKCSHLMLNFYESKIICIQKDCAQKKKKKKKTSEETTQKCKYEHWMNVIP